MYGFFLGGTALLLAAIAASVSVVQTKRTENRSKAGLEQQVLPYNPLELPIVEFGTIEKIKGVGALPNKTLAVLGESTETTPSATPTCDPNNPIDYPAPPPNCRYEGGGPCVRGILVCPSPTPPNPTPDLDRCLGRPNGYPCSIGCDIIPVCKPGELCVACDPVPGNCQDNICVPAKITPTIPPPTPKYIFKTFDGRTYVLQQPQFRCPKGENCIQVIPPELNFDQYLGTPVMIEGVLKRSSCKYAPEVTDYRCEEWKEDSRLPVVLGWWPLPKQGIFEARNIHNARIMGKDEVIQPFTGILSTQTNYANENVYMINDFQKCRYPLCGQRFIRSATTDLSRFLNQSIQVNGPSYALGGDIFLDAVSVSTSGPTVTPTQCGPDGTSCTPWDICATAGYPCDPGKGVCKNDHCIPVKPTPPPVCYYHQVQCIKAPCDPILVCPTPGSDQCQNQPDGSFCQGGYEAVFAGYCKGGKCIPGPTPTPSQNECTGKPDGVRCGPLNYCPPELQQRSGCFDNRGVCTNGTCLYPTPTPYQDVCNNQPEGSQCSISDCPVCDPKPGLPCPLRPCQEIRGICRNRTCQPPTPTASTCNGAPDGVTCTRTVCRPRRIFSGFGNFLPQPDQCRELPGVCQNNVCIEPPKPTIGSCRPGDINKDGSVNESDLGLLLVDFFKREDRSYPPTDINGDGIVDISDYSLLAKDYGTVTGTCY